MIDDYYDKFTKLVFKIEIFVPVENDYIFEILFIHRFYINFDFNFQQYCENYFQIHDVFDKNNKIKFIFFYVIKRLINVVIVFNINTFAFVIDFHVCTNLKCFYFYLVFVVSNTSIDSIIQNEAVSKFFNKIIIKLIFHYTHCDKNYYNKNYCKIFHFEFKKKRLTNRRNRNNNNNNNKNNNNNNRRNRNNNNNDNDNENNNNNNQIAKQINNNLNNIKKLKSLKTFIVVNFNFLEK